MSEINEGVLADKVKLGKKHPNYKAEAKKIERNDSKTIPNDLLLVWLAQKILEEYGTIAEDLETNVDKIICRYNAGKVNK